jgi:hypothetical protein
MKKAILFGALAVVTGCLSANTASAQLAWTPEQKAVWKTETTIGDLQVKGDLQGALALIDEDFQNWAPHVPVPVSKDLMAKRIKFLIAQGGKMDFYEANPSVIWVSGDYAYTDYNTFIVFEDKDGKKKYESDRNLDVLIKKDGKWLIVGSMTNTNPTAK